MKRNSSQLNPKSACIVTQTKNNYEYVKAFIPYHLRCVDKLFIIDHNSTRDLRTVSTDKVSVYRSNIALYALDLTINSLLAHVPEIRKFDWIFVLDIDEFLPFPSKGETVHFMEKNSNHRAVYLRWQNGIPIDGKNELAANTQISFQSIPTKTTKLAYNSKLARIFWIRHGNHHALFMKYSIVDYFKRYIPYLSDACILHIPFLSFGHLKTKLNAFPKQNFRNKINRTSAYLVQKYGENWIEKKIEDEDLVWLVANYRNNRGNIETKDKEFSMKTKRIFKEIKSDLLFWEKRVENCPPASLAGVNQEEQRFLDKLRKRRYSYSKYIKANTNIDEKNAISLKKTI